MYDYKEVAKRVKTLRLREKMTQEELAEAFCRSSNAICKIENCIQAVTVDYGLLYAEFFNVSLDYIYYGDKPVDDEVTEKYNAVPDDKKNLAKRVILCSLDAFL